MHWWRWFALLVCIGADDDTPWFVQLPLTVHANDNGVDCDVDLMMHVVFNTPSVPHVTCVHNNDSHWTFTLAVTNHNQRILDYLEDLGDAFEDAIAIFGQPLNVTHHSPHRLNATCGWGQEFFNMTTQRCTPRSGCPGADGRHWSDRYHLATSTPLWNDDVCLFNSLVIVIWCVGAIGVCACFHCCVQLCGSRMPPKLHV